MTPEIGQIALVLALVLALVQAIFPLLGAWRGRDTLMAVARPAAAGQLVFVLIAYVVLTAAFVQHDFSVLYVAQNSNSALPLGYRLTAVWGGHEGSLLLWMLMLAGWTCLVAAFSRHLPAALAARVLGVMGLISIGFLAFMLFTSNPFARLFPVPPDGRDLNPLLQDPGMIIHPPMLYLGYVGFSVAFAFAVAALLGGRLDATWARWTRPWTIVAWLFLTIGIALGSWWAYYELGWGGWWFWDPVENASFMPWLVGTALIHSLAVTEKRGALKAWTVLLAIAAFSLSLLGTFLVRSGVLTSVHAFATDPTRGLFILVFLSTVIGGSLLLYAWRAPSLRSEYRFALFSREGLLLVNNLLLTTACGAVLIGTLYPLVVDALGRGKISVGPPYFDTVFLPLMLPLLLLVGIGPAVAWRSDRFSAVLGRLRRALLASALFMLLTGFWLLLRGQLLLWVSVVLAGWIVFTSLTAIWQRLRLRGGLRAAWQLPRSFYGMHLAHLGLAVFALGVGVVNSFEVERTVRMAPGETTELAGYQFRFVEMRQRPGPNWEADEAEFQVFRNDRLVAVLTPQKRRYPVRGQVMTQAGIDGGVFRDLFVALGEPLSGGAWSVRLHYKPWVRWIWGGTALMALGGALAASDRRYRAAGRRRERAARGTAPAHEVPAQ